MTNLFDFTKETITTNTTVYAKWSVNSFTLTFNSKGGTEIASQIIKNDEKAQKPADPTRDDYFFKGWYKEETLINIFDFTKETITTNTIIYAKWEKEKLNTSMAWVSMREGLVQFDNATQGAKNIGVIVSREATPPTYASVKDLPSFYTRKTKIDGTPRTVYLSMTDEMTTAKFNANVTISIDGQATGFVSAIVTAPEILHPNTDYYVHFYEIKGTLGIAIEKLSFTTEDFPANYPTSRGTYSSFYNQTSPAVEYKASENYLFPFRYHYLITARGGGGPYAFTIFRSTFEFSESSKLMRPFSNSTPAGLLFYDLYNITPSGPSTNVALWDGMLKLADLTDVVRLDHSFGGDPSSVTQIRNLVLVTE